MKTDKYIPKHKKGSKKPQKTFVKQREGLVRKIVPKAISRVRKDLDSWRRALRQADSVDRPRRRELMDLYADVMLDALLTSQIEQRIGRTLSLEFSLKDASGKVDEEATRTLSSAVWFPLLIRYMLESVFYGHSLVEFSTSETDGIGVTLIPRQNVVPEQGLLLYDSTADEGAYYRELREYGTYVVEFGAPGNYGLLNKAVPHALFKKFAHSCWSELCEIYGIPPRYIKTNTQDPAMLDRAEDMLRDMGSAAYFIIDTTEEFQFARKYSINSLVYWVTYVHNVVYSFYRSMIYCYINSTQRCAGSIVIDIIPTNGADKRKFFPFAPYFPVTNVIKRYFYPYFPAIIGIKGYSFPYFPYLSGIMKIKTALYSLFSRLDWHKTVVFPCLGEIYEGIRSLSWEIPVT